MIEEVLTIICLSICLMAVGGKNLIDKAGVKLLCLGVPLWEFTL